MILVVGQNAAWQKVCMLARLERGEVNRIRELHCFASSKGPNAARALSCMGVDCEVLSYAGGASGELFAEGLRGEAIRGRLVRIQAETRVCTTLAEDGGTCTELIEPAPRVTEIEREAFARAFRERVGESRVAVLCGTAAAGESEDCYARCVCAARERGVAVLIDSNCAQALRALAEGPEILKINQKELGEMTGMSVEESSQRVRAEQELAARHGIRWFLVSRGPAGMEGFDGTTLLRCVPPAVQVVNTIGSGDAAAAGAAWALHELLQTRPLDALLSDRSCLEETLARATSMGTANCMNPINGKVIPEDYRWVKARVKVEQVQLP